MKPPPSTPGQTPLDDLSGLRIRSIRTAAQLNEAEAENIRKAAMKYLVARPSPRSARFDVPWLLRLHAEMFGDVWEWAGTLRTRETNIGSAPHQIEIDLHNLLADLKAWESSGMDLLEQAVRLHHGAVRIHPFLNGNGRWSRMLSNIWLMLHGSQAVEWPEATIGASSAVRDDYLAAVRTADRGDYSPLIGMHRRYVNAAR
ncbi:hypothetical protein PHYC_03642 [Phycisphaerales bacterium]|nr:hypothetical protein PHYC_03642 [Phycisphaerales bacterium]